MTSKLAEHLRTLPDDGLGALLQLRPDLVVPVPADISALASRAQGRVSVALALDGLDQFTLEVLDGLRLVRDETGVADMETLLTLATEAGAEPAAVRAAVDRLRARFLVFGPENALHLVRAIDELTSPYPAGLGRPAADLDVEVADLVADPARLRRTVLSAPPEARAVLDRLAAGPPVGTVSTAALRGAKDAAGTDNGTGGAGTGGAGTGGAGTGGAGTGGAGAGGGAPGPGGGADTTSPVRWLVAHRLLVAVADDLVELPREVGLVLRRETGPLGVLHPQPPAVATPPRAPKAIESAGAGQALEAVRHLDALLHALAETPAPVLKSFGLGVRDLRRLARETGISEEVAATLVEIAYAGGLLNSTDVSLRAATEQRWLPTPAYDTWRTAPLAQRWAALARTWLDMTRVPGLVGQRDDRDRLISALSFEAQRMSAPAQRRVVLDVLADQPSGAAPEADEVLAALAWRAPRRIGRPGSPGGPLALARSALAEAAMLGVTGLGAMTGYGRRLLAEKTVAGSADEDPLGLRTPDGEPDALVSALADLLPPPVDHFLIQADLTVIVPGPPEPGLAAELALVADAESRGGATVYRVTTGSVRRALDSGYAAPDIHALFRRRSRTSLPQTLTYLIDDVARRHGGLRLGVAGTYLRSDDEALLNEVFADRRLAALSLRRLAPTVLATQHSTARLLEALREAGYAPVPEDATGAAVLTRPKAPRASAQTGRRGFRPDDVDPPRLHGPRLAGVVEQIRLGDRLARATRRSPLGKAVVDANGSPVTSAQAHMQALGVLQQAMRDQTRVWVGYVDAHGSTAAKLVRPVSMGAGYLRAEDDRTETLHTFALHRITSAALDD
jgi:hypothetical protein